MMTFKNFKTLLLPTMRLGLTAPTPAWGSNQPLSAPLSLSHYVGDSYSFHVSATLVIGKTEVLLIDTGFTRADALRIAALVMETGKTLTTILISNADPDYYFGAEVLKEIFPCVKIVTTPAVQEKIQATLKNKLAIWETKMGINAPRRPIIPDVMRANHLTVNGERVEVRGATGVLAHRPFVWIPSIRTIAGNSTVVGGLHAWTADAQKISERTAWIRQLDEMLALNPTTVVPGHRLPGSALDEHTINYTKEYLHRFDIEVEKAKNSRELIARLKSAYPQAGGALSLEISARVFKGEI